jgi:hypothetical protein
MAHTILGVQVKNRAKNAEIVHKVFTEFGCNIKTRIGLHDVNGSSCSPDGIIVLELFGEQKELDVFESKLNAIKGIIIKKMVFD